MKTKNLTAACMIFALATGFAGQFRLLKAVAK
jgi:hypothetical protein